MRQGAQGAWEFHLPYTSEDEYQTGGFVYPFYLLLGKLAPLGLSYPLLYHGARLLSSLLLLIVLAKFIARFVSDQRWQVWTWWLLLFSGGWGLLISLFVNPEIRGLRTHRAGCFCLLHSLRHAACDPGLCAVPDLDRLHAGYDFKPEVQTHPGSCGA